MSAKITVDDVLTKSPEEILKAIHKRDQEPLLPQPKQEVVEEGSSDKSEERHKETPVKVDVNFRKMLKGMFIADQEFVKGQVFHFEGYDFFVIGIENSSKRVRFRSACIRPCWLAELRVLDRWWRPRETSAPETLHFLADCRSSEVLGTAHSL